jgi:ubiquinone/menaquinone biosynthesis C-methylase UbiE
MNLRKLKKSFNKFLHTPIHPQWLCAHNNKNIENFIKEEVSGITVLDIGCATKWPVKLLPSSYYYIGIDFLNTAKNWYKTQPDVYGDAQKLPIASSSIDSVLLLDVLEHLQNPDQALNEIFRVLKTNGALILQVPFLYPIHDAPCDYRRWSKFGLKELASHHGFVIEKESFSGNLLESSAVISNIAMTKTILNWLSQKRIASVFVFFLPFYIMFNNILNWMLSKISLVDDMMPMSYQMVWKKKTISQ